jgi:protein arginine N-methyltransferase 1
MSCIKELALAEPLVDGVEPQQIVTDAAQLATFDITTMTKEDATFTAPFTLTSNTNDYVHAFVGYFGVRFGACHKPVVFSTGPQCKLTHWKQTVFYLQDPITICSGETISGTLSCR